MEEISERHSRLGIPHRQIIPVHDVSFQSTPEDLSARYSRIVADMEELLFFRNRSFDRITEISTTIEPEPEPFFLFNTISYEDFIVFLEEEEEEECQRPRQAPRKARRRHDPPPRVSRRSSQVSPPIYLRHRFLPQSRKDSSSRRRQR
ncbi:unnamed protein product [Microthlaspi erraticum]|uniref:Uncharacterized protein n=1 Tax=Microthlaspi erraticum TaxID=1685480 RepID=A0A6D2KL62_9BRAS|nr:unnamed protein product [Microthlaspi erraticum]